MIANGDAVNADVITHCIRRVLRSMKAKEFGMVFAFVVAVGCCSCTNEQRPAAKPENYSEMTEEEYQQYIQELDARTEKISSTFDNAGLYSDVAAKAESFTVLIGLPHQTWEAEEFEREKKNNRTVDGQFYTDEFRVGESDAVVLRNLLGSGKLFKRWTGWKACGGFHADYRLICQSRNDKAEFDICFGCDEIHAKSKDKEAIHVDMAESHIEELKKLLRKFKR